MTEPNEEFIRAGTHFQACVYVQNVETFIEGLYGITGGRIRWFGDVALELSMAQRLVMHKTIPEEELQQAAIDAINEAVHCKDDTLSILQENVYAVIGQDNSDEIEEINRVIAEKQAELLKLVRGRKDYAKCADEMDELQKEKHLLLVKHAQQEGVKQRINELTESIQEQPPKLTEFDDKMVRKYIEQIEVFDDKFIVRFKAKFELELTR